MASAQKNSFKTRILSAVLWSVASTWSTKIFDFIVVVVLARLLSPSDFGIVAIVTVYMGLGQVFVQGGLAQAIIQREEVDDLHLDTAFWASLSVGLVLTVCTYIFAPDAFVYLFNEPILGSVIEVTSVLFTIAALQSVQYAYLTRLLKFKQLAIRRAVGTVVGGATALVLAYLGFGVWSLVALNLARAAVAMILLWVSSDWRPRLKFSTEYFRDLFSFGMHILGGQLIAFFSRRGINFFIGFFLGTTALGYYVLASRIVLSVLDMITTAIQSVAFPAFSRLQSDQQKLRSAFYQAIRFSSLISFPSYVGIATTAVLLVSIFLGQNWTESAPVLQILCFFGVLDSITRYTYSAVLACGRADLQLQISIFNTLFILIGFFIVVDWGIVAVAGSRVATGFLVAPVGLMVVRRLTGISYRKYFVQMVPAVVASTAMAAVVIFAQSIIDQYLSPAVELAALILIGIVAYAACIHVLDRSIFKEVSGMLSQLKPGHNQP